MRRALVALLVLLAGLLAPSASAECTGRGGVPAAPNTTVCAGPSGTGAEWSVSHGEFDDPRTTFPPTYWGGSGRATPSGHTYFAVYNRDVGPVYAGLDHRVGVDGVRVSEHDGDNANVLWTVRVTDVDVHASPSRVAACATANGAGLCQRA